MGKNVICKKTKNETKYQMGKNSICEKWREKERTSRQFGLRSFISTPNHQHNHCFLNHKLPSSATRSKLLHIQWFQSSVLRCGCTLHLHSTYYSFRRRCGWKWSWSFLCLGYLVFHEMVNVSNFSSQSVSQYGTASSIRSLRLYWNSFDL